MRLALRLAVAMGMALSAIAQAQMTIGGFVRNAAGEPVEAANVAIPALDAAARTNADGSYNILVRAALVRGQTVVMTARHGRHGTQSVAVQIVGGSLRQDFVLTPGDAGQQPRPGPTAGDTGSRVAMTPAGKLVADGSLGDTPGALDLESALAGRFAALRVTPAASPGGSPFVVYRGIRSLSGPVQPLVVVDGVPVDNLGVTTAAQRAGLGGFDYGTPLGDVSLADVAEVELLDPLVASMRYGSRAANGVIEVRTRSGRGLTGFAVTLDQHVSGGSAAGLPEFQNDFGQGLGGAFEFFDGLGGGVNDAAQESWGPRLDARPLAQHSLVEPRRPDVRYWLPQPDDTREYFTGARAIQTSAALVGSRGASHLRMALHALGARGLTPGHESRRLGATLGAGAQPTPRVSVTANIQYIDGAANDRPGTGWDEVNPVAGFARMGRQVDLDALRSSMADVDGDQINWIYTDRNNPFVATARNSNKDDRRHVFGRTSLSYDLTRSITATISLAADEWRETRRVSVIPGWRGGFPTTLGRGDFSGGGSDIHRLDASDRLASASITARPAMALGLSLSGMTGVEMRRGEFRSTATVTDRPTTGDAVVVSSERDGSHEVTSAFAMLTASRARLTVDAGARLERSSSWSDSDGVLYPGAQVTLDATPMAAALGLGETRLAARLWGAGNEITTRTLATAFYPGTPVPEVDVERPERTSGLELAVGTASRAGRVALDITGYRERSRDLLVIVPASGGGVVASRSGELFNGGVQGSVRARLLGSHPADSGGRDVRWDLEASLAHNSSTVDRLVPGGGGLESFEAPLSPDLFGARVVARVGGAAGIITGSRLLRNQEGDLVLRNGLPVADASAPFAMLGSIHPDWTATLRSDATFMGLDLSVTVDARIGGEIFSATNMWGSYAGTLESTLVGDRAPGATAADSMVVRGVDSTSGAPNAIKVSAEQYFHALGAVVEPWVYDASYTKLREVRLSYRLPTRFLPGFRQHSLRVSVVGRNLVTWSSIPNIDPESPLSGGVLQGIEMGQLPGRRTLGLHIELFP